jgi:hypothetical protein
MNKLAVFILISFVLFLATGINLYSQELPPTPEPNSNYQQSAPAGPGKKGGRHQHPLPISAPPPPQNPVKEAFVGEMGNQNGTKYRQNIDQRSSQDNFLDIFSTILITLATIVIAAFTYCLYRINRELFIATHKPRLRVHSLCLEKIDPPPKFNGKSYVTHQLHCSVNNIGGSSATIIKKSLAFKRLNEPLPIPAYCDPLLIKKTIACGESITESVNVEDALILANNERGVDDLYFFGYIDYRDNTGTTRRTAFCRRYIRETKRFTKVKDEDYEYSY